MSAIAQVHGFLDTLKTKIEEVLSQARQLTSNPSKESTSGRAGAIRALQKMLPHPEKAEERGEIENLKSEYEKFLRDSTAKLEQVSDAAGLKMLERELFAHLDTQLKPRLLLCATVFTNTPLSLAKNDDVIFGRFASKEADEVHKLVPNALVAKMLSLAAEPAIHAGQLTLVCSEVREEINLKVLEARARIFEAKSVVHSVNPEQLIELSAQKAGLEAKLLALQENFTEVRSKGALLEAQLVEMQKLRVEIASKTERIVSLEAQLAQSKKNQEDLIRVSDNFEVATQRSGGTVRRKDAATPAVDPLVLGDFVTDKLSQYYSQFAANLLWSIRVLLEGFPQMIGDKAYSPVNKVNDRPGKLDFNGLTSLKRVLEPFLMEAYYDVLLGTKESQDVTEEIEIFFARPDYANVQWWPDAIRRFRKGLNAGDTREPSHVSEQEKAADLLSLAKAKYVFLQPELTEIFTLFATDSTLAQQRLKQFQQAIADRVSVRALDSSVAFSGKASSHDGATHHSVVLES